MNRINLFCLRYFISEKISSLVEVSMRGSSIIDSVLIVHIVQNMYLFYAYKIK